MALRLVVGRRWCQGNFPQFSWGAAHILLWLIHGARPKEKKVTMTMLCARYPFQYFQGSRGRYGGKKWTIHHHPKVKSLVVGDSQVRHLDQQVLDREGLRMNRSPDVSVE
ncbi:hypothetical protein GWK47_025925 [Chionoecetes opilio]|uniref:Uncharacterized protein n=1 Tax=Chionoecetes opilio TaxID=41210 RepID=A0A8J8WFC8_CHIOP|nr:hypothetical protein GWK47_025925 [Chionoecetes opilio]